MQKNANWNILYRVKFSEETHINYPRKASYFIQNTRSFGQEGISFDTNNLHKIKRNFSKFSKQK